MQIDPSQPIMFDSDSPPGKGTGMWQVNPFFDNAVYGGSRTPATPFERRVRFWFAAAVLGGLVAGASHMFFA